MNFRHSRVKKLSIRKKIGLIVCLGLMVFSSVQAQDTVRVLSVKTGTASFYNKKFQGRKTSSGERLDNSKFTAAHPSIPFGSMVRVTNQKNGKSVVVRINDRFSPRKGHLIDLTYSAAKVIDMIRQGMARVKLELLDVSETEAESIALVPKDTINVKILPRKILLPITKIQVEPSDFF